jgi:hypothetical protein
MDERPLAELIEAMRRSKAWRHVEQDIRERRDVELEKLLHDTDDYPSVCHVRGFLAALTWLCDELIPGLIADAPAIELEETQTQETPETE